MYVPEYSLAELLSEGRKGGGREREKEVLFS
jgi:hypothetical protein